MDSKVFPIKIGERNFQARVINHLSKDWVAIRPVCEAVGVDEYNQTKKLKSNPQFSCHLIMATGADGKQYNMACLPLEEVAMWLCGINANRTKPEIRDVLISFQKWCQMELYAAINGHAGTERIAFLERVVGALTEQVSELRGMIVGVSQAQASAGGVMLNTGKKLANLHVVK
jgi:hypothetical protein